VSKPFDPAGRTPPRLLKPPGSIPSIGGDRPVAQPPPLAYPPLGPIAAGDPGKGPGVALADHRHPPQAQEKGLNFQENDFPIGTRPTLDFLNSASVTWSVFDDPGGDRVTVSADATGSGSSLSPNFCVLTGLANTPPGPTVLSTFTRSYDPNNMFNTGTGKLTLPVAGNYIVVVEPSVLAQWATGRPLYQEGALLEIRVTPSSFLGGGPSYPGQSSFISANIPISQSSGGLDDAQGQSVSALYFPYLFVNPGVSFLTFQLILYDNSPNLGAPVSPASGLQLSANILVACVNV